MPHKDPEARRAWERERYRTRPEIRARKQKCNRDLYHACPDRRAAKRVKEKELLAQPGKRERRNELKRERNLLPENKAKAAQQYTNWRNKPGNKEREALASKLWVENNKERMDEWTKQYRSQPNVILADRSRSRLNSALKAQGISKTQSTFDVIGCTQMFLVYHIENQFLDGMSWDNKGDWQVDHRFPLSAFDLSNNEEMKLANHYSNLQPLWKFDNISKKDKVIVDGVRITDKETILQMAREQYERALNDGNSDTA